MAGHMGKYQAILLDNSNVALQTTTTLNLVTLLLDSEGSSDVQPYCLKSIDKVYSRRQDLLD